MPALLNLLEAVAKVLVGDGSQVVQVVKVNIRDISRFRVNVPWHGEVDEEERAVGAVVHRCCHHGPAEDSLRGGSRGQGDIKLGEVKVPIGKGQDGSSYHLCELVGMGERSAGNGDAANASAAKRTGGGLTNLSAPQHENATPGEALENPLREVNRHCPDSGLSASDLGMAAQPLGGLERLLEETVEAGAQAAALVGLGVGSLNLAQDLGLSDHLRVQSATDANEVGDHIHPLPFIHLGNPPAGAGVKGFDKSGPRLENGVLLTGQIDLDAVAGAKNQAFVDPGERGYGAAEFGLILALQAKMLAHLQWCGVVAATGHPDRLPYRIGHVPKD